MAGRNEVGVGVLLLGAGLLLAWMAVKIGGTAGLRDAVEVEAVFGDVTGLQEGAAVSVAGVQVGRVRSLEVEGDHALVTLAIEPSAGIREDVEVRVRARSLLGEKYIDLRPTGSEAPLLRSGERLSNTVSQVEITDMVTELAPALRGLDAEQLNRVIGALAGAIEDDPERPRRMLEDAEASLAGLRAASEQAPEAIGEVRAAVAELRGVAARTRPILERADRVLGDIEAISGQAPELAERLPGMVDDAAVSLGELRALTEVLGGETEAIQRVLANLEDIDKWELRRLLREEGILIRMRPSEVVEDGEDQPR